MNELQVFQYQSNQIRTILDEQGNPWLVAKDIAEVLGLESPRSSLALLEEDERGVHTIDTLGGPQDMAVINEPGLYSLILRSRKPEAKAFKRWITHEVLPQIRRTGSYSREISRKQLALMVLHAEEEKEKLLLENESMKPKVEFYDTVAGSRDAIEIGMAAKVLNFKSMGRNRLFRFLREQKILMKDNQPYQEYVDREYFRTIEQKWHTSKGEIRISIKTVIYQRGIDYIRKKLMEEGFEPVERAA